MTPAPVALAAAPIVSVAWLRDRIDEVVVVDTRRASDYLDAHLPGAVSFQLGTLMVENTRRSALERLGRAAQQALAARGIAPDTPVVLVDDNDGSACLGVFICELAGVRAVSALHGGIAAWLSGGGESLGGPPERAAVAFDAEVNTATIASFDDLVNAQARGTKLVDTRSQLEHEGIVGSPCCLYRGHIPGSLNLEWSHLLASTGDVLPPDRIREHAHHVGLSESDDIIVYCHSGHRSAVAGLALRAAGFEHVRNSLGSWHEWSHSGLAATLEQ